MDHVVAVYRDRETPRRVALLAEGVGLDHIRIGSVADEHRSPSVTGGTMDDSNLDANHGAKHRIPRTWHDAYEDTEDFQALLRKYPTYQEAVDAWVRGERAPEHEGGNANPM